VIVSGRDGDAVEHAAEHEAVGPVGEVASALEGELEVAGAFAAGALGALEVEAVVAAVDVAVDRLVAEAVEAVTVAEVAPAEDAAEEQLVYAAIEVLAGVREEIDLAERVVVAGGVVEVQVLELEVAAVVEIRPLLGRDVGVDLHPIVELELLQLAQAGFLLSGAGGAGLRDGLPPGLAGRADADARQHPQPNDDGGCATSHSPSLAHGPTPPRISFRLATPALDARACFESGCKC
jgi:hypothetical protein